MKSKAVKLKPKQTEEIRNFLIKEDLIRRDLKIKKEDGIIYIPIKEINGKLNSFIITDKNFEKIKNKPKILSDIVSIPNKLKKILPKSYDIIGNIVLLKLEDDLLDYKQEIGKALINLNKNVRTVCNVKPIKGEYRTRDIEIIAGEKTTKTIHTEYKLKFEVDIKKTYFSPRLATERKRVSNLVKSGEVVVDMFAGVAPFSIMIAKYANPKIVYSLDKNKYAIQYAIKNVRINNLLSKIDIIHSDVENIKKVLNKKESKIDRIIMNLPFSAHLFFKNALSIIKYQSMIHYYDIIKENEIQRRVNKLKSIAGKNHISLEKIEFRKIKSYSPREFYIGIDIKAKKTPM